MTEEEMLQLIEQVLNVEANTLTVQTRLDGLAQWDSLNVLNLQIELTAIKPDVSFDSLHECNTVADIYALL